MRGRLRLALLCSLFLLVWVASARAGAANERLTPENRMAILRRLAYEYATTLQPLPASIKEKEAVEVDSSGHVNEEKLRQVLANRGVAVQPGEIVQVTNVEFQRDAILFEINGGGKKKKKWYERIRVQGTAGGGTVGPPAPRSDSPPPPPGSDGSGRAPGSWIVLSFSGALPNVSAEQVKQLLAGVLDFSRQSAAVSWIETIPEEFRQAIEQRRAVAGMDRKMVLAALGQPERKVREIKNGQEVEDWIYGNPPFVTFVTFAGDTVVEVKEFR
jgi:hypothetical protein